MSALGTAYRAQNINREQVRAQNLARAALEEVRFLAYDPTGYQAEVDAIPRPAGYSITVTTGEYCNGVGEPGYEPCFNSNNIQKNTVKVSRDGKGLVTIEDLKTRRE